MHHRPRHSATTRTDTNRCGQTASPTRLEILAPMVPAPAGRSRCGWIRSAAGPQRHRGIWGWREACFGQPMRHRLLPWWEIRHRHCTRAIPLHWTRPTFAPGRGLALPSNCCSSYWKCSWLLLQLDTPAAPAAPGGISARSWQRPGCRRRRKWRPARGCRRAHGWDSDERRGRRWKERRTWRTARRPAEGAALGGQTTCWLVGWFYDRDRSSIVIGCRQVVSSPSSHPEGRTTERAIFGVEDDVSLRIGTSHRLVPFKSSSPKRCDK